MSLYRSLKRQRRDAPLSTEGINNQMWRQQRRNEFLEDDDETSVNALTHPVILNKIFGFLDTETLHSVRLVCLLWAETATSFLGRQGRLTLTTESQPPQPSTPGELSFSQKLIKETTLYMDCICPTATDICHCPFTGLESNTSLASKFGTLWSPTRHKRLTTLNFTIRKTFNPCLHEILKTYHFPSLKSVTIIADTVNLDEDDDLAPVVQDMGPFQPLEGLKLLNFWIDPSHDVRFLGAYLSSLCQGLVNVAPNLEKLDLVANFYPDLTPCEKLDEVEFAFVEFKDFCTKDVIRLDAAEVKRMLESCDSLQQLTLNYHPCDKSVVVPIKVDFVLPNLVHLTITAADVYRIEDSLNTTNLPELTHLSVSFYRCRDLSVMAAYQHAHHDGITVFHVGCTTHVESSDENGHSAVKLDNNFPAVDEFKLKLRMRLGDNVEHDFRTLKEAMESLGGWRLKSGQVDVQFVGYQTNGIDLYEVFASKVMIAMLDGLKGWKGLSNTSLRFFSYRSGAEFKLTDGMRDALLACRTIGNVAIEGFQMRVETDKDFDSFIGENNLKIKSNNRTWVE